MTTDTRYTDRQRRLLERRESLREQMRQLGKRPEEFKLRKSYGRDAERQERDTETQQSALKAIEKYDARFSALQKELNETEEALARADPTQQWINFGTAALPAAAGFAYGHYQAGRAGKASDTEQKNKEEQAKRVGDMSETRDPRAVTKTYRDIKPQKPVRTLRRNWLVPGLAIGIGAGEREIALQGDQEDILNQVIAAKGMAMYGLGAGFTERAFFDDAKRANPVDREAQVKAEEARLLAKGKKLQAGVPPTIEAAPRTPPAPREPQPERTPSGQAPRNALLSPETPPSAPPASDGRRSYAVFESGPAEAGDTTEPKRQAGESEAEFKARRKAFIDGMSYKEVISYASGKGVNISDADGRLLDEHEAKARVLEGTSKRWRPKPTATGLAGGVGTTVGLMALDAATSPTAARVGTSYEDAVTDRMTQSVEAPLSDEFAFPRLALSPTALARGAVRGIPALGNLALLTDIAVRANRGGPPAATPAQFRTQIERDARVRSDPEFADEMRRKGQVESAEMDLKRRFRSQKPAAPEGAQYNWQDEAPPPEADVRIPGMDTPYTANDAGMPRGAAYVQGEEDQSTQPSDPLEMEMARISSDPDYAAQSEQFYRELAAGNHPPDVRTAAAYFDAVGRLWREKGQQQWQP